MASRYLTLDWTTLHRDSCRLAVRLREQAISTPWCGIVAIARGGLIPATIVARMLDIRLVETVSIATYDEEIRGEPAVLKHPSAAGDGAGFLVIDDLVDSGVTAQVIRTLLPHAYVACLYAKPEGQAMADLWLQTVPQDTWIVFPWDEPAPNDRR